MTEQIRWHKPAGWSVQNRPSIGDTLYVTTSDLMFMPDRLNLPQVADLITLGVLAFVVMLVAAYALSRPRPSPGARSRGDNRHSSVVLAAAV